MSKKEMQSKSEKSSKKPSKPKRKPESSVNPNESTNASAGNTDQFPVGIPPDTVQHASTDGPKAGEVDQREHRDGETVDSQYDDDQSRRSTNAKFHSRSPYHGQ